MCIKGYAMIETLHSQSEICASARMNFDPHKLIFFFPATLWSEKLWKAKFAIPKHKTGK